VRWSMRVLRRIAEEVIGADKARRLWGRLEIVGDIAVIKSSAIAEGKDEILPEEYEAIAEELMKRFKYVRSVWLATAPMTGDYRLRGLRHLAGEKRTVTVYKEHGCSFKVDIARVFVTPRLSYEHSRIASLVRPGEVVVNMFAGVGLFSVIIAKKSSPRVVHSIDINPYAYRYMIENIKLNGVEDLVIPHLGDAAQVVEEMLVGVADRVLMPLPELALDYTVYAVKALRDGRGTIHFYLHKRIPRGGNPVVSAITAVKNRLGGLGVELHSADGRIVRKVGPRAYQVVVDAHVGSRTS